ncbi:hypothetical protein JCM15519_37450 [Fundidesulfovibrio butyratiphilus]
MILMTNRAVVHVRFAPRADGMVQNGATGGPCACDALTFGKAEASRQEDGKRAISRAALCFHAKTYREASIMFRRSQTSQARATLPTGGATFVHRSPVIDKALLS